MRHPPLPPSSARCVRFIGPDLADIATAGGSGYLLIWSAGGEERRVRSPRSRASSPLQAASHKSYSPVQRLIGHSGQIWDLACSGNDVLFSAGGDSTIRCVCPSVPLQVYGFVLTLHSGCGVPFMKMATALQTIRQIQKLLLCLEGTRTTCTV
jgi:hypothetical protein